MTFNKCINIEYFYIKPDYNNSLKFKIAINYLQKKLGFLLLNTSYGIYNTKSKTNIVNVLLLAKSPVYVNIFYDGHLSFFSIWRIFSLLNGKKKKTIKKHFRI